MEGGEYQTTVVNMGVREMTMRWLRVRWRLLRRTLSELRVDEQTKNLAIEASVKRIFWTAPVLALGNFLAGLSFWLRSAPAAGQELLWQNLVIGANFTVSLIGALIWLLAWRIKRPGTSPKVQAVLVYGVAAYVLAVGLVISLIDQLVMSSVTPFLLCVTIVGTFYYLYPHYALALFSLAYLIFHRALIVMGGSSPQIIHSNQVNALIVTALGFALSLLSWIHFRTITLQQRTIRGQQVKLSELAYQDPLTGLPNRRFMDERIKAEVALVKSGCTESSLLMCDIDHFKSVNDTYGHLAGDDLLRELAALLQSSVRENSTLVRLGGEEFVILAPGTSLDEGKRFAERLRKLVENHRFLICGHEVRITMSIGVAALTGSEDIRDYYNRADRALYAAKEQGRNQVSVEAR